MFRFIYGWRCLSPDDGGGAPPAGDEPTGGDGAKTFTQEEVNRMMANEKRQGRMSVLKDLGVEADDEAGVANAKDALKKYKESLEAQKTEIDKAKEKALEEEKKRTEAEQKALLLQNKVDAIANGVKPEYVDDALAIAMNKVSNEKDLKTVLTEMKERYAMFFADHQEGPGTRGTGTPPAGRRSTPGEKRLGERLGEQAKAMNAKSSYFTK